MTLDDEAEFRKIVARDPEGAARVVAELGLVKVEHNAPILDHDRLAFLDVRGLYISSVEMCFTGPSWAEVNVQFRGKHKRIEDFSNTLVAAYRGGSVL